MRKILAIIKTGIAAVAASLILLAATDSIAFGQQEKTWGNFSLSIPSEWKEGLASRDQDSWTFGDPIDKKLGFFAFYLSRRKPETLPLEQGAKLIKIGPVAVSGKSATSYDMTYLQPDKRYRLIALDQLDAGGNCIFIMAGVDGLDFSSTWPMLERVIASLRWIDAAPPSRPPIDQTQTNPPPGAGEPKQEPMQEESIPDAANMQAGAGITPAGWQRKTWKTYSWAVPADWKETEKSSRAAAWGIMDANTKKVVMFGMMSENKPFDAVGEPDVNISLIGAAQLLGQPAKLLEVSMNSPDGTVKGKMVLLALDLPDAEGRYLAFNAAVSNMSWEEHWPTLHKAFASISAASAGGGNATVGEQSGSNVKPASTVKLWDIVTVIPPVGWKDLGDPEGRMWMSEMAVETRATFVIMRGKKVLENLTEMKSGPGESGRLAGRPATLYTGKVSYYKMPVKVWLLDDCLPDGDRMGVMLGGNDPDSQQEVLDSALAGLKFDLPQGSASCGLPIERSFQGVSMIVPGYFQCNRLEQYGTMECNGFDISTLTELKVWLVIENVPYSKERGVFKDKFEKIGSTGLGRVPATAFNAEIKGSEGIKPSRVIVLDKPLKNGKNLSLELFCPENKNWSGVQAMIDRIIATVKIDPSLLPEGMIAAVPEPASGSAQKASRETAHEQSDSMKIDSADKQTNTAISQSAKTEGKSGEAPVLTPPLRTEKAPIPPDVNVPPVSADETKKTDAKISSRIDASKPNLSTDQAGSTPPIAAASGLIGSWNSEQGPVVFQIRGGKLAGYWMNDSGKRGEIIEVRIDGASLIFDYLWPGDIRGQASFSWNVQSQHWDGNWRHLSGQMGGWNLRK